MAQDWRGTKNALERFGELRKSGMFSDCEITLNYKDDEDNILTKIYHVHAIVLLSASAFFEAILSENFIEGQNRKIVLHNIQPKHFELFLDFIYQDRCSFSDAKEACEVYKIADEYLMSTCMAFCKEHIWNNCDIKNALACYEFSLIYNLNELRQKLLNRILLDIEHLDLKAVNKTLMANILDSPVVYDPELTLFEKLTEWIELQLKEVDETKKDDVLNSLVFEYIPKVRFFEMESVDKLVAKVESCGLRLLNEEQINSIKDYAETKVVKPIPAGICSFQKRRIILAHNRSCVCVPVSELCSKNSSSDLKSLKFTSKSVVKLNLEDFSYDFVSFSFYAKKDGWIFFQENEGDFVRISIQDGSLCLSFRFGKEERTKTFQEEVMDGKPHLCQLVCLSQCLSIFIDKSSYQFYPSDCFDVNLKNPIQLGGEGYSFEGCISQLFTIPGKVIDYHSHHVVAKEVQRCSCEFPMWDKQWNSCA